MAEGGTPFAFQLQGAAAQRQPPPGPFGPSGRGDRFPGGVQNHHLDVVLPVTAEFRHRLQGQPLAVNPHRLIAQFAEALKKIPIDALAAADERGEDFQRLTGEGRWAEARGRPRLDGHHAGAESVRDITRAARQLGADPADYLAPAGAVQSAVRRAVAAARPGARVVAFGPATARRWAIPVNAIVRSVARRYVTTFEGFDAPWSHLAAEVPGLRVHRLFLGAAYLAGLAVDFWGSVQDIQSQRAEQTIFTPHADRDAIAAGRKRWHNAVERSKGWNNL